MVNRGLIELARAKGKQLKQFGCQSKPLKGLCQNSPLPTSLQFQTQARDTHQLFGLSLDFLPMLTTTQAP